MGVVAGTGVSRSLHAAEAGREAAGAALRALTGQAPALVVVYASPSLDLPALLAAVRSVTGSALLVGATGAGATVRGEYLGFGGGVAVLALTAGPYRFSASSGAHIRGDLDGAGRTIVRGAREGAGPSPHAAVLVFCDALLGDLQQLMQGVYRIAGPRVPLVGAAAGDDQKFQHTSVFHDGRVVDEGAVAVWISSGVPLRAVSRHGWRPIGVPMLVTRAEGTEILELGGRSAAAVFGELLGLPPDGLPPAPFQQTARLHPFGLPQSDGSFVIRMARARTERGSLVIQGCVPQVGSAVQVMESSAEDLLSAADEVGRAAVAAHPDPGVLLCFSCAARVPLLGGRAAEESRRLQAAAGTVPAFGLHGFSEFIRTAGVLATHNATMTAMVL